MDADEIRDIATRLGDAVRAQMEPMMASLYDDCLVHGMAVIRMDDGGQLERVLPVEWLNDFSDTTHSAKEE